MFLQRNKKEIKAGEEVTFTFSLWEDGEYKDIHDRGDGNVFEVYSSAGTLVYSTESWNIRTSGYITQFFVTILAAFNDFEIGENYKAVAKFYDDGLNLLGEQVELFDVVTQPIYNPVQQKDLYTYLPDLETINARQKYVGTTTTTGTTITFIDTNLKSNTSFINDIYVGGDFELYLDDTVVPGHIADTTATSGTITASAAIDTSAIPAGVNFSIRVSLDVYIQEAFYSVKKYVRSKIGLAGRLLEGRALYDAVLYKALSLICFSSVIEEGDTWHIRYLEYKTEYEKAIQSIDSAVDYDDDGNISDYENDNRPNFSLVKVVR